jgi:acyl-coenzyme A thioesterase PaaI-like protein
VSAERARLIAFLTATPYVGFLPALHGGVLGGFLELTALVTLAATSAASPRTVDFTIEYLRSAGPRDTHARATIRRLGRRFANVDAVAWQDDPSKPVAAISGRFSV